MKQKQPAAKQRRAWVRGRYGKKPQRAAPVKPQQASKPPPVSLAGLTPRERLDAIHAHQALLDLRQRQGELVEIGEVEAGHAEMREIIRADLLGTLPLRLAARLAERKQGSARVRETVLDVVREILKTWHQAGAPVPDGDE
jgi:hypothetical protein